MNNDPNDDPWRELQAKAAQQSPGSGGAPGAGQPWLPHSAAPTETLLVGGPGDPDEPRRRGWRRAGLIAGVTAVVVGGGFAVAAVAGKVGGGGTQPEDVLPASSVAYADVDFDPSLGQKVAAVRFLRHFPDARKEVSEDDDLRKVIVDALTGDSGKVDFRRDVEPWLGQRLGVALLPSTGRNNEAEVAVAVQVTDEDAARAGLRKVLAAAPAKDRGRGMAFRDGYAIVAPDQATADRIADQDEADALSARGVFREDMESVTGEGSLSTGWIDMDAAQQLAKAMTTASASPFGGGSALRQGRASFALRLDGDDVVEVLGRVAGSEPFEVTEGPTDLVQKLPTTTVAAFSLTGLGEATAKNWNKVVAADGSEAATYRQIADSAEAAGFRLPEDLATLLGDAFVLTVDEEGLGNLMPEVGLRTVTDPARAQDLFDRSADALRSAGAPFTLVHQRMDDGAVAATSPQHLQRMQQDGGLGDEPKFTRVLPDADDALFTGYVNFDRLAQAVDDKDLAALGAFGISGTAEDDGSVDYRVRISVD